MPDRWQAFCKLIASRPGLFVEPFLNQYQIEWFPLKSAASGNGSNATWWKTSRYDAQTEHERLINDLRTMRADAGARRKTRAPVTVDNNSMSTFEKLRGYRTGVIHTPCVWTDLDRRTFFCMSESTATCLSSPRHDVAIIKVSISANTTNEGG